MEECKFSDFTDTFDDTIDSSELDFSKALACKVKSDQRDSRLESQFANMTTNPDIVRAMRRFKKTRIRTVRVGSVGNTSNDVSAAGTLFTTAKAALHKDKDMDHF